MATYTLDFPLGRPVIPAATVRRWRLLGPQDRPLVSAGMQVRADQSIAERGGGDEGGETTTKVLAGLDARVVEVTSVSIQLEGVASVFTGVVGLGGSAAGPLTFLTRGESAAVVPIAPGGIIVYPQPLPLTLLQRAAAGGAAGIVAGSMSALELEGFARADLTAALDGLVPGLERFPFPLMLTEGVGSAPMDPGVLQLLTRRVGQVALLSGRTLLRANLRPELLLPLPMGAQVAPLPADSTLVPRAQVRISSGAMRGRRGELVHLFAQQQRDMQGLLVAAAQVRLDDGRLVVVALAALDRIA
ncbi:MAG TPA: hypothetical protein VF120_11630 [Ktedonobacterales bacterium]